VEEVIYRRPPEFGASDFSVLSVYESVSIDNGEDGLMEMQIAPSRGRRGY
jgi:hypothetical protein